MCTGITTTIFGIGLCITAGIVGIVRTVMVADTPTTVTVGGVTISR